MRSVTPASGAVAAFSAALCVQVRDTARWFVRVAFALVALGRVERRLGAELQHTRPWQVCVQGAADCCDDCSAS